MTKTLFALCAMLSLAAPAAIAQQGCDTRDAMTEQLTSRYGEQIRGAGLRSETAMIELWQSPETGSWSLLMTRADGTTCIIAHGTDWTPVPVIARETQS